MSFPEHAASSGAQVIASSVTAATLALTGLPYLALLWSFLGAVAALIFTSPETRGRAFLTVFASGVVGGAGGNAAAAWLGGGESALIVACLVAGAGAKPLLTAAIEGLQARIKKASE
jgi:hypothetical protein